MNRAILLIAALGLTSVPVFADARAIDMAAFRSLVTISSPRMSPDGSRIAFVKTVNDFKSDSRISTLEVVSSSGGAPVALSRASAHLKDPQWSPRGDRIAYMDSGRHKQDQLFVVPARGGNPAEITDAANGVEQYAWSPDGTRFAYVTQDDPLNAAAAKHGDDLFEIHDDGYLTSGPPQPSHLWLVSSHGGAPRRLTRGTWSVLETAPPFVGDLSDPSWSHDGRYIAFTRQANAEDGDSDRTTIAIADVRTGTVRNATAHAKYEYQPLFCPTDDTLAYLYPHGPGPISVLNVFTAKVGSIAPRDTDATLDRDVTQMTWLPDGKSGIVMADDGIDVGLWRLSAGAAPQRMDLGSLNVMDFNVGRSGAVALVLSNETTAPELYVMTNLKAKLARLTSLNAGFANYQYGQSQELQWKAPDGERSDGIVTYPVGYVAGRKYPLVVYLHGGPEAASSRIFDGGEIGRLRYGLTSHGYIVFEPNYRGSDNLGNAHEHGIYRDPGTGPGNDVMAGVKQLESHPSVDTSRIAVVGHSYGGYMTAWLIGHEHFWRSAVVADGMVDWRQEYNFSAAGNLAWTRDSLGGTPTDLAAAQLYVGGSPITYVRSVTTPTLILSGTADETVPITESYELYHALRDRGVPVQFIGIPGAHHSPSKPEQVDRYYAAILDWVAGHMQREMLIYPRNTPSGM
jgi:dipeptidyl aminopeptidase/acylaminoacyl peptidase